MTEKEKENRIHSFALNFLERQQIVPNLYADQIIRGYKEGYHQAEKDLKAKEVEEPSKDLEEAASQYSFNIQSAIFNDLTPVLQNIWKREIEGDFIAGAKWMEQQLKDK